VDGALRAPVMVDVGSTRRWRERYRLLDHPLQPPSLTTARRGLLHPHRERSAWLLSIAFLLVFSGESCPWPVSLLVRFLGGRIPDLGAVFRQFW